MEGKIGFVGLGAMGLPMARRLGRAGFQLIVHDRNPAALEAVRDAVAIEAAADLRAVITGSETLITCLPDPQAVEEVYGEVDHRGLLACDCSTVGPALAIRLHRELAGRGVRYVECPMLGGAEQAARGELFLILSGAEEDARRLQPILEAIGRGHRYVGGPGSASRFKVVQNGLGHVQMVAIAEALTVLAKAGADLASWCEVVAAGHGMADTPLFRAKAKDMLVTRPEVRGTLRIAAKDAGLAAQLAAELGVEAPVFAEADRAFRAAMALDLGDADFAEVARVIERRAGVSLTGS